MSNLKEFVVVWTLLLVGLFLFFGMAFLPVTKVAIFLSGVITTVIVVLLKKTYCTFKEESRLDSMFE